MPAGVRKGPVGKCYWKKFRKSGPWRRVMCTWAFSDFNSLLTQFEKFAEKKDKQVARLKKKIEELKRQIPQKHWRD